METFLIIILCGASLKMLLLSVYVVYQSCCGTPAKSVEDPVPRHVTTMDVRAAILRVLRLPVRLVRRGTPPEEPPADFSLEDLPARGTVVEDTVSMSEPPPYSQVEENETVYPPALHDLTDIPPPYIQAAPPLYAEVTPPPYTEATPPPYTDTPPPYT